MIEREWRHFLADMIAYGDIAVEIVDDVTADAIGHEVMHRLALERALSVIGEAASRVPDEIKRRHHEVPWAQIVALRHRLVHGYGGIDHQRLHEIATDILPDTLVQLRAIERLEQS